MADIELFNNQVYERGSQPSVVESFTISGLYGYRTVSLASPFAATVLIARNGSGKTTLLAALDAFLRGQLSRLRDLDFREIRCKLRGVQELILYRDSLSHFVEQMSDSELAQIARKSEISPQSLLRFLVEDYPNIRDDFRALSDDPVYSAVIKSVSYSTTQARAVCDRLIESMFSSVPELDLLLTTLRAALKGVEIVYLPTYRRVELPLLSEKEGTYERRKRPRLRFGAGSLFTGDIQFGLGDISERLSDLNQRILVDSNLGYRTISANIINELIDGTFDRSTFSSSELPSKEELTLFFSRLKAGVRRSPFNDDLTVPEIDKIYTGEGIAIQSNKFLRYFLSKLGTVISATRDIETSVTDFIESCNRYLSAGDPSVIPPKPAATSREPSPDDKVLRLNRRNMKVHAESVASGRRVSLDALSSGEKQMISLFAKLYLYPENKIILIDEPELSLSLDWQKRILPDVIMAPLCRQVIAITHSPFVFDNPLEPFARSLQLAIDPNVPLPSADEGEADSGD